MILREKAYIYKGEGSGQHVLIKRRYTIKEGMIEVNSANADFTMDIKSIEQGHQWISFKGESSKAFILDASFKGHVALEYIRADNTVIIREEEIIEEEYIGVSFYPRREKINCQVLNTFIYPLSYYEVYLCIDLLITFK